ncbi:hypothetical protein PO909_000364 [Leuciscus waleckii]
MASVIEVKALGRPLFLGTLYNCREDSFIPDVTLWDMKSLSKNVESHPQPYTDSTFHSSDSLSSKFKLLDVSASLKASFLAGLVTVDGSAKYLHDTKSSKHQSRVTLHYSTTTRYEHLTISQLGQFTYPQVFDWKTATHVVTAVLYGAQAFMVFDRKFSEEEKRHDIEGHLEVMASNLELSIKGEGSVNMTDDEKKCAEKITWTFHGDINLKQNPTTYVEAIHICKDLPNLMEEKKAVPIKVWLYPLHLLNNQSAQLEREISTSLVSDTADIIEKLEEADIACNDLIKRTVVNTFNDFKERLQLFQKLLSTYKTKLLQELRSVLPTIRGGNTEEKSLEEILNKHRSSPFNDDQISQWLHDADTEFELLSSATKSLKEINIKHSNNLINNFFNTDVVVCFTFTSLKYEDPYLSTLKEFLKSDRHEKQDGSNTSFSVKPPRKWFNDHKVIKKLLENLSQFRRFVEANKYEKRISLFFSAISNPSIAGSSIYLYEKGELTDTQFQPMPKPPPPIVKKVWEQTVSLKLHTSSSNETMPYRVEYKQVKPDSEAEEQWLFIQDTYDEDTTLTGLESGKKYLIRCKRVGEAGLSEASDTVSINSFVILFTAAPVIVGGTGGDEFTLKSALYNQFKKIIITYNSTSLNTIQVIFQDGQLIQVGSVAGLHEAEFLFENTDKIVTATLWPNKNHDRFGGLEFEVEKSNDEKEIMSIKSKELGEPVMVNVGSGRCYGITGRSGEEINALGFYFI